MSTDYNFHIETSLKPEYVIEIAARVNNTEVSDIQEPYSFRVQGIFAVTTRIGTEIGQKLMLESYNFSPNICVTFEHYSSEGIEAGYRAIALGTASMLLNLSGKAILLYNGEITIVERLDERCLLTNDHQYDWLATGFDEVGMKYERRQLESPLL